MPDSDEDDAPLKVLAVANFDSFLRAAGLVANLFSEAGAQVETALIRTRQDQISAAQVVRSGLPTPMRSYDLEQLCRPEVLGAYDIVLMALDGSAFRRFFLRLDAGGVPRPLTVAIYPGVVLRYHYDGLAARSPADFLWLNSEHDLSRYREMCDAFSVGSGNARAFGLPSLLSGIERIDGPEKMILFGEQVVIPRTPAEREYLAQQLVALAHRHANYRVVVKPRHRVGEFSLHRGTAHIEALLRTAARQAGGWPANLEVSHDPIEELLASASVCLTISSTVALQAIHAGVPTALVSDFGAHEDHGLPFFFGSGLFTPFADFDPASPPLVDANWRSGHLLDPAPQARYHVDEVLAAARGERPAPRSLSPLVFGRELENNLLGRFGIDRLGTRSFSVGKRWISGPLSRLRRRR